jgi:hypothetical protein
MAATITIAPEFCGPPGTGNGGYTAGRLAAHVAAPAGAAVEVTLRRPPPLGRPLAVDTGTYAARLLDGDEVIAEARPVSLDLDVPRPLTTIEEARTAAMQSPVLVHRDWHPVPGCFVCGIDRTDADGLRVFPGPVRAGRFATTFTPPARFADSSGALGTEFVWALLDCPSSFGIYADGVRPAGTYVLGRLAARIDARPQTGDPLVIEAWRIAHEGRKLLAGSALVRDGRVFAIARATWLRI